MFNKKFCAARSSVECTIGILKTRFRVLANGFRYKPVKRCSKAVQALAGLHNYILHKDNDYEEKVEEWTKNKKNQEQGPRFHRAHAPLIQEEENGRIQTNEFLYQKFFQAVTTPLAFNLIKFICFSYLQQKIFSTLVLDAYLHRSEFLW